MTLRQHDDSSLDKRYHCHVGLQRGSERLAPTLNPLTAVMPCRRPVQIFWAHEGTSMAINGPSIELQRMAALAGLTYWNESSGLSLHPKYGSWFALRAVLVFEGVDYTGQTTLLSIASWQHIAVGTLKFVVETARPAARGRLEGGRADGLSFGSLQNAPCSGVQGGLHAIVGARTVVTLGQCNIAGSHVDLSSCAGMRPMPLTNPMSNATLAYLRMATRSARSFSVENIESLSKPSNMSPANFCAPADRHNGPWIFSHTDKQYSGVQQLQPEADPIGCNDVPRFRYQRYSYMSTLAFGGISTYVDPIAIGFLASSAPIAGRSSSGDMSSRRSSGSADEPLTRALIASRWQRWAAVRDVPCPGHPWRYCPAMLQYHYTNERSCLLSPKRCSLGER